MTVNSRKPTGKPSWPMVVLGGREKAGKTWAALSASKSDLIDHTYYVGIGEDDPDEYALIPGVDFDIVVHDGSFRGILAAIDSVAAEKGGKPHLLVVDSMTKLWDLIVDNAQAIANKRAKGNRTASGDYAISPDLWNVAANQWKDVMDAIRRHRGPSILTARLDEVMVMENGQPTKDKRWKVQAHKSLVFDAGVVVEMHERGHALITGTKSVQMSMDKPTLAPGFTITDLWDRLGITASSEMGDRVHASTVTTDPDVEVAATVDAWEALAKEQTTRDGLTKVWKDAQAADVPIEVLDAIRTVAAEFVEPITGAGQELKKATRLWLRDARAMATAAEVQQLFTEAKAQGVDDSVLNELADMAAALDAPKTVADEPWAAVASEPADEDAPAESESVEVPS